MRNILLAVIMFASIFMSAQDTTLTRLKTVNVYNTNAFSISYNPCCSQVYKTAVGDLAKSDPLYPTDDYGYDDIKMIKTRINSAKKVDCIVVYSEEPSADPHYVFYTCTNPAEILFIVPGEKIVIPGNGLIYSAGRTNNTIEARKKFAVTDSGLTEVKQPYYYSGMKSKALIDLKLYDSEELKNETGTIPAGTEVQILLKKDETELYLIMDSYGITGWIDAGMTGIMPTVIEGLFYSGD